MKLNQKELTELLIRASRIYYGSQATYSILSDTEFDEKKDELAMMEEESGIVYPGSPTHKVGAESDDNGLVTVIHKHPALSLDKIKYAEAQKLVDWAGDQECVESWKMDGLTLVLTYDDGRLVRAATRGNDGVEGKDITHNAVFFHGIPHRIAYKGYLEVRGEATMSYAEFNRLDEESGGAYQNPRNLATATVQMLDASLSRKRRIDFSAFQLVEPLPDAGLFVKDGETMMPADQKNYDATPEGRRWNLKYHDQRLMFLKALGFNVVEFESGVTKDNILDVVARRAANILASTPTDGLVFSYNDMVYGESLGATEHHPKHSIAFKWSDEAVETIVTGVDWGIGKTGALTPVAIFEPIRLGAGSTITRASLSNVSLMMHMPIGDGNTEPLRIGSRVWVYLANMIIPKIRRISNTTDDGQPLPTEEIKIPEVCPVCGHPTKLQDRNGVQTLYCVSPECPAKVNALLLNAFSKDGLNVNGLGESQIDDLLEVGLVDENPVSFYVLAMNDRSHGITPRYDEFCEKVDHLMAKDGWGKKKWDNLMTAIEQSRKITLRKFLYSLNIPMLGTDLAKKLSAFWHDDVNEFKKFVDDVRDYDCGLEWGYDTLVAIKGIGKEKARSIIGWISETTLYENRYLNIVGLINELDFPVKKPPLLQRFINDLGIIGMTPEMAKAFAEYWNNDIKAFTSFVEKVKDVEIRDNVIQQLSSIKGVSTEAADNFGCWMWEVATVYNFDGINSVLKIVNRLDELYAIIDELNIKDISVFLDDFEAVDDQGMCLEGIVTYMGEEYFCHVNYEYALSLEQEIAENILRQLDDKKAHGESAAPATESVEGLTFVITGNVNIYKNRDEFKESVEARGGKVAGSVSAKTSFLVNNDVNSGSGKNQKAKELGIPIISEKEFIARFGR